MDSPLNLSLCHLEKAVAHRVGNKHNGDQLLISDSEIPVHTTELGPLLSGYFLKPFNTPEFFHFTSTNGDSAMNPVLQFCSAIFSSPDSILINSIHIAKHLYALSEHPNIKPGDIFIAYFGNVVYDNVSTDAVGIFKAENKQKFLKIDEQSGGLRIDIDAGINIDKLDKGCIVINTAKDDGYRVLAIDRTNRGQEAHYWMEGFLRLEPLKDNYFMTREIMNETRQFVVQELPREASLDRASQIDLLNKSAAYFKEKEQFDPVDFEETVFREAGFVDAYRNFKKVSNNSDTPYEESEQPFDISGQAVKKYGNVYKSVLKLDKNFHVYIHGDKNLIERGRDDNGRKYYKLYYEEES